MSFVHLCHTSFRFSTSRMSFVIGSVHDGIWGCDAGARNMLPVLWVYGNGRGRRQGFLRASKSALVLINAGTKRRWGDSNQATSIRYLEGTPVLLGWVSRIQEYKNIFEA